MLRIILFFLFVSCFNLQSAQASHLAAAQFEIDNIANDSALGQEVLKVEENNVERIQLDCGNLPTGIYFHELGGDNKVLNVNRLFLK